MSVFSFLKALISDYPFALFPFSKSSHAELIFKEKEGCNLDFEPFSEGLYFFHLCGFLYSHCILMEQEAYILSQVFYKDAP